MAIVQISSDPNYGFIRKIETDDIVLEVNGRDKKVNLRMDVLYYKKNGEEVFIDIIPPKTVVLSADNGTRVDPSAQGLPYEIPEGGWPLDGEGNPIYPEGSMGEWDFFLLLRQSPVVINDMILGKILWADSRGRFDQ